MDLHVVGPLASPVERAAIESVTGPREPGFDGHGARGGHAARDRRHLLLPALHAVQSRVGWISQPALNEICRRLSVPPAEAYGVASFYALLALKPRPPQVVHVCDDIACLARGAGGCLRGAGADARACRHADRRWLGHLAAEPVPWPLRAGAGRAALERRRGADPPGLRNGQRVHDPARDRGPRRRPRDRPWQTRSRRRASQDFACSPAWRQTDATVLAAYRGSGGYAGLERALAIGAQATVDEVLASKLVGRGGAAFPTGRKWAAVADQAARPHYLVCNADESEPGTFKDRVVMERDPFARPRGHDHRRLRGRLRAWLPLHPRRVPRRRARDDRAPSSRPPRPSLLGPDILGSGFGFEIEIRRGAGAYICGEETALFNSIEGRRGEPRNKPPFPVEVGLFGKPTVVNNVETLANVPLILRDGGEAYRAHRHGGLDRPQALLPLGQRRPAGRLRGRLRRHAAAISSRSAGGVEGDHGIQAILLGGAAGVFVGPDQLDMPLTFEGTRAAGATLGSGVIMVFDETVDLPTILLRIARFFRDESCGQCVPCRVGTVRQEELLHRLATDRLNGTRDDEMRLFNEIAQAMRDASICGLGQTAAGAIGSAFTNLAAFASAGTP